MKIRTSLRSVAGLAAGLAAAAAQAHPGHGLSTPESLLHVLESEHVVPLLLVLGVGYAVVALRALRRRAGERKDRHTRQDR